MKKTKLITDKNHRNIGKPGLRASGLIWMAAFLFMLAGMTLPKASAQTAAVRVGPVNIITAADSGTTTTILTNLVNISGGASETLNLLGAPTGDTFTFSTVFPLSGTSSFGTTVTNVVSGVVDGVYGLDFNASGSVVNDFVSTLWVGRMWTGVTNQTANWSSSSSWVGGNLPDSSSDVLFTSLGAGQTLFTNGVFFANSIVDQNFTIDSLRFSMASNGATVQSIEINPGVTLNLTGTHGLLLLQDAVGTGSGMTADFSGQGGTLNVNNPAANVAALEDATTVNTLDMSRLGTFTANINRLAPGDYTVFPDATNMIANGYGSSAPFALPKNFTPRTSLAMTNVITAHFVDPFNYTNSASRSYAIELINNINSASGSGSTPDIFLGLTNSINADGLNISGFGGTTAAFGFNQFLYITTNIVVGVSTNFTTNSMYARFRNADGVSRMTTFTIGDLANPLTNSTGNTKGNVDLASWGGHVDMLVDKLYMGRDRTNGLASGGDDAQTTLSIGAGTINANNVIIGDQESGDQTNQNYVFGTLTVSNTALLVVNNALTLGYQTADELDKSIPGNTFGRLLVNAGGTAMINSVYIGSPTDKYSGDVGSTAGGNGFTPNTISLTGGTLIVSNLIADASAIAVPSYTAGLTAGFLGVFNMVNSTLELFLNGTNQGPYVYTSGFTFTGSTSNTLVIGSIQNLTVPSNGSTNIPLMWIPTATPNAAAVSAAFTKIVVPSGFQGALVLDATNSQVLDLNLSQHTPNNLKWEGYANSTWDTTSLDWLDMASGLHTNFQNGDFVTFDDSTTITNVGISGTVQLIPNNILVTNNTEYYQFSGSSLIGGASFTKAGTGFLEFNASMTLGTLLNAGTLVGHGTIGGVNEAAGATLNYVGTINGNVTIGGLGLGNGVINGLLTLNSGGIFTNFVTLNGAFNAKAGSLLFNASSGQISYGLGNTGTIASNAVVVNGGNITADELTDSGTFEDLGVSMGAILYMNAVTVNSGGVFYPGADALGETVINDTTIANNTYGFDGSLVLAQGATEVLNVDNGSYTTVQPVLMSFGASASQQTQAGAILKINNLGAPFTAGETFNFFPGPPGNTGTSTNTFPVISPATPGPGLAWDLTQLWGSGTIGIVQAGHGPTLTNSFALLGATNIVIQLSWNTNNFQNYFGYRLESQVDSPLVGLTLSNANWTGVSGSWTNGAATITNTIGTNCVFYRLVFP